MERLKTYEGFLDLFRKKSEDDKIVQIYIDRLKKVKGISPYHIDYVESPVLSNSDDAVSYKYKIEFHDTPVYIMKGLIISPQYNRYTTEVEKSLIDDGAIFKNSKTFYLLHLPHQGVDVKADWGILERLWKLAKETYDNDQDAIRIKKIKDDINPAADLIEDE